MNRPLVQLWAWHGPRRAGRSCGLSSSDQRSTHYDARTHHLDLRLSEVVVQVRVVRQLGPQPVHRLEPCPCLPALCCVQSARVGESGCCCTCNGHDAVLLSRCEACASPCACVMGPLGARGSGENGKGRACGPRRAGAGVCKGGRVKSSPPAPSLAKTASTRAGRWPLIFIYFTAHDLRHGGSLIEITIYIRTDKRTHCFPDRARGPYRIIIGIERRARASRDVESRDASL